MIDTAEDMSLKDLGFDVGVEIGADGKCHFTNGIIIKPDGENELDACFYKEEMVIPNCTVHILKCKRCGHIEYEIVKQSEWVDEEDFDYGSLYDEI